MLGRRKYIVPRWFVSVCLLEWMNNVVQWLLGTWIMGYDNEHPTMAPNFCMLARLGFRWPSGRILSPKCFELLASQGHTSTICVARGCIIKMTYQAACPLILLDACTHALYRGFFLCFLFHFHFKGCLSFMHSLCFAIVVGGTVIIVWFTTSSRTTFRQVSSFFFIVFIVV